ncbi:hypothetical protein HDU81_006586 [Chytriomyces hyalinus]|nr:hypothetical protein HDU81_006586 [Chytriomyces hyalinus]
MTSTQGVTGTGRGVGTAGAQTYGCYSSWYPKYAVYLNGPNPGHSWAFGHRVYGDKDIRPLGGDCYEIVSYYITYSPLKWTTNSFVARTTRPTTSTTSLTDADSPATATVAASFSMTTDAPTTRTSLPNELTVSYLPTIEGTFTGTVYTDPFDNSTFVVICGKKESFPTYSPPWAFVGLGLGMFLVVMGTFLWFVVRCQTKFWSTHTASFSVGPSRVQQAVVGSTDPQHIAMLQQQQRIYVTPLPSQYNGYGQPANVQSNGYPVHVQFQNSDGVSAPAPAAYGQYNYSQQNYAQQNYGQHNASNICWPFFGAGWFNIQTRWN